MFVVGWLSENVNTATTPDTGTRRTANLVLATWVSTINFWAWNMIGPLSTTYAGLQIGLGIGRLVFRALNSSEVLLAVGILLALALDRAPAGVIVVSAVAFASLVAQLFGVRPRLARRSDAVLAGQDAPRSRAHYAYVALEVVKVIALAAGGILLLSG